MFLFISALLGAGIASGAAVQAPAATPTNPEPVRTQSLPSGSSDAFRRKMLEWTASQSPALLRIGNAPRPAKGRLSGNLAISSPFGWRTDPMKGIQRYHQGVDLPARFGSPVIATGGGIVRVAGWAGGYGNLIEIEHPGGVRTRYGHLARLRVFASERIEAGQRIGDVGSTGRSTGPHVHYEVRVKDIAVNPLRFTGPANSAYESAYETVWASEPETIPGRTGWTSDGSGAILPEARIR